MCRSLTTRHRLVQRASKSTNAIGSTDLITDETGPTKRPSLGRRIVMFPVVRIILAIAAIVLAILPVNRAMGSIGNTLFGESGPPVYWVGLTVLLCSVFCGLVYAGFGRVVERRKPGELIV